MFTVGFESRGPIAVMVASGPCGPAELLASTSFLAEMLRRTRRKHVLLDMLALRFELDVVGDLKVLGHLLDTMPPIETLAVVVPLKESHKLVVTAARQRGVTAEEFATLAEAQRWLLAPSAPKAA